VNPSLAILREVAGSTLSVDDFQHKKQTKSKNMAILVAK